MSFHVQLALNTVLEHAMPKLFTLSPQFTGSSKSSIPVTGTTPTARRLRAGGPNPRWAKSVIEID